MLFKGSMLPLRMSLSPWRRPHLCAEWRGPWGGVSNLFQEKEQSPDLSFTCPCNPKTPVTQEVQPPPNSSIKGMTSRQKGVKRNSPSHLQSFQWSGQTYPCKIKRNGREVKPMYQSLKRRSRKRRQNRGRKRRKISKKHMKKINKTFWKKSLSQVQKKTPKGASYYRSNKNI